MAKKSKKLIETMEFDNYAAAQAMVDSADAKRKRIFIGLALSAVATACSCLAFSGNASDIVGFGGMFLALVAYIVGGGFGSALKLAWGLAKFGWIILPFPYDIVTGFITFFFAIIAFVCFPVVFVLMSFFKHNKEYSEAKKYLSYYKKSATVVEE